MRRAQAELAADGFAFVPGLRADGGWAATVAAIARSRRGEGLPAGWVPETFLLALADGELVGRISVRHRLTPQLERIGGHIGFCVLPAHRRRGHATRILRAGLDVAWAVGVESALLTCDETNTGSRRVIERCGGAPLPDAASDSVSRYVIDRPPVRPGDGATTARG